MHQPEQAARRLPSASARTPIHTRRNAFRSYAREDGLWDVEGEIIDVRHYPFTEIRGELHPAEAPVHDMAVRFTVDRALVIQEVAALMASAPFGECPNAVAPLQALVGARIGTGWRRTVDQAMGGTRGCTHLRDLVMGMATAAMLAVPHHARAQQGIGGWSLEKANGTPVLFMGQCMTWAFEGPLVKEVAPQFAGWPQRAKE